MGDIDALVASTEQSTNSEIPMQAPEQTQETAPPVEQTPQEYEFEAEGRKYKGDIAKLTRWAQQGVSAPNKIGELARQVSEFQNRFKQYESYDKTYKPIDEWAKQNPDKWNSLFQNWQQAQFGGQSQPGQQGQQPAYQVPPEILQKIQDHDQKWSQFEQKEQVQKQTQADQGLDGEISSIRKQYSNLDFDAPDASGNSLEYQVLKHATDNGIPSFRAAFRDYCFDKLSALNQSKGKESAAISPQTKAGLLGKNQAPAKGTQTPDLRGRSYDQIHQLILERELGQTG